MTDNTFKQNTFVLKEDGKIVWIEKMPEVPSLLDCQNIHFGKPDSDSGRMLQKLAYKQAVQSAIANGIEVSNQIHVKDHINPFGAIGEIEVNKPYTLNCRVEIKQQEVPCPDGIEGCMVLHSRAVAHVTFPEDKPEQKRVTFDEQPERTHSIRCASYTSEGLRKRGHIAGKCDCQPEAAGQEQEMQAYCSGEEIMLIDFFSSYFSEVSNACRRGHNLNGRKMSAADVYKLLSKIRTELLGTFHLTLKHPKP
jgi:hypothetical protein